MASNYINITTAYIMPSFSRTIHTIGNVTVRSHYSLDSVKYYFIIFELECLCEPSNECGSSLYSRIPKIDNFWEAPSHATPHSSYDAFAEPSCTRAGSIATCRGIPISQNQKHRKSDWHMRVSSSHW